MFIFPFIVLPHYYLPMAPYKHLHPLASDRKSGIRHIPMPKMNSGVGAYLPAFCRTYQRRTSSLTHLRKIGLQNVIHGLLCCAGGSEQVFMAVLLT